MTRLLPNPLFSEPSKDGIRASMKRMNALMDSKLPVFAPKPRNFKKPVYNTPDYWRAVQLGWIGEEEIIEDRLAFHSRSERAKASYGTASPAPTRHNRSEPRQSRQYAPHMATTAFRDDRLTPNAARLLAIVRARCGNGRSTDTTKATLANIMSRSTRSIQRYIAELVKFGYLRTVTRSKPSGWYVGLRIWITDAVLPFFSAEASLAVWLMETTQQVETKLSPKNESPNILSLFPSLSRYRRPKYA